MKYRIGIDLGASFIKGGIIDAQNQLLHKIVIPTLVGRNSELILHDIADVITRLMQAVEGSESDLIGIGIGCPGMVDTDNGIVVYSPNLDWNHVALGYFFRQHFKTPTRICNETNCAALGEVLAGAAKEARNCILLTLGTGVGGGIIMNGAIFEGAHPGGVEIGHMMLKAGGELCSCGRRGCLEAYASATALIRDTKKAAISDVKSMIWKYCHGDPKTIDGKTVFLAAAEGDPTAKQVIADYISYIGDGILDMIHLFRPDKVLLSGGVCNEGDALTVPLREYVRRNCFGGDNGFIPSIEIAELGDMSGIIGAAGLFSAEESI